MPDPRVVGFVGVALVLIVTPGSDLALVMRNTLAYGRRAALFTVFGICSGLAVYAALSVLGLAAILARSASVFEVVKLAGAAYLVYLGVRGIRDSRRGTGHDREPDAPVETRVGDKTSAAAYVQGMLNNLLNPKVAVFYVTFLPQFIAPGQPVLRQTLLLAALHIALSIVWLVLYVYLIGRLAALLTRSAVKARLAQLTGLVLIGLAVRLVWGRG